MLNIYKASAGSGKTYRLTLEYIKLLLTADNDKREPILIKEHKKNHSHILAITFTNKATEEMKSRIIKELSHLADVNKKSNYRKELSEHFNADDDSVANAAKIALYDLLFNYTYFNVSTIDSFFQLVLRTFAQDIDRPDNFEVSLDDEYILTIAVNRIFDKLGDPKNKTIKEWVKKSISKKIEEGDKFNIFNRKSSIASEIVSTLKGLMNEDYRVNSEIIDEYLSDISKITKFEDAVRKKREAIISKWKTDIENILKMIEKDSLTSFFKKKTLFNNIKEGKIDTKIISDVIPTDIEKEYFSKSSKGEKRKNAVGDVIIDKIRDLLNSFKEEAKEVLTFNAILKNIYTMGLLGVATKEMKDYCRENDIILISDTNEVLGKIIGHEPAPFIYERMGIYLHHFLIDEFQDTSKMQWNNMLPLVIESLSKGYENLIIGDEKQCIYRFRNSKPELLGHEAQDFIEKLFGKDSVNIIGEKIEENTNWRSSPIVIRFNNTLFYLFGCNGEKFGENAYKHVIQDIPEKNLNVPGYVRLQFIKNPDNGEEGKKASDIAVEKLKEDLTILISEKGFKPSEIAILVDTNSQASKIVSVIEDLKNNSDDDKIKKLQVIVNDALTLNSSSAVKIIINTLKLIIKQSKIQEAEAKLTENDVQDDKVTKEIQYQNQRRSAEMTFLRFSTNLETNLGKGDCGNDADAFMNAYLAKDDQPDNKGNDNGSSIGITIDEDNVGTTIDHIISRLPEKLRIKENLFICAFVDAVLDYSEHSEQDIISFLNWWENTGKNKKVSFPTGTNSITISTIHKSKGLEFKAVIIPFANWNFYEGSTTYKPKREWVKIDTTKLEGIDDEITPELIPIDFSSNLESTIFEKDLNANKVQQRIDQLNKTYVAFTRAENVLIVYVYSEKQNDENIYKILDDAIGSFKEDKFNENTSSLSNKEKGLLLSIKTGKETEPGIYEFGTLPYRCEIKDKDEDKPKTVKMPEYESFDIKKKFSGYFKPVKEDSFDPNDLKEKGTFLHNVLCDIEEPEDLDWAFLKWKTAVRLDEELSAEWKLILKKALSQKEVYSWFHDFEQVINEHSIVLPNDKIKRPDRVVITKDEYTDIIDYKTGGYKDYSDQVKEYVDAYRRAGFKNVRGFVWYINTGKIVTIDDGLTAKQILFSNEK